MVTDTPAVGSGPRRFGELFGKVMQRHPKADARLVNDVLRVVYDDQMQWAEASTPPTLDVERLSLIRNLQPQAVEYIRQHGFVFDKVGPLPDDATDLDRWKVLAFSLYNDVVEASMTAENILARLSSDPAPGEEVGER